MMKIDCIQEAIEEGREKGREEGKIDMIKNLLKDNEITVNKAVEYLLSANCKIKTIVEITKLPVQEIRNLTNTNR